MVALMFDGCSWMILEKGICCIHGNFCIFSHLMLCSIRKNQGGIAYHIHMLVHTIILRLHGYFIAIAGNLDQSAANFCSITNASDHIFLGHAGFNHSCCTIDGDTSCLVCRDWIGQSVGYIDFHGCLLCGSVNRKVIEPSLNRAGRSWAGKMIAVYTIGEGTVQQGLGVELCRLRDTVDFFY